MTHKLTKSINDQINSTTQKRYKNRGNSYEFGMELLFQSQEGLKKLAQAVGGGNEEYNETVDALATEILQCGIDYFLAVKDKRSFSESNALEILNSAKSLTKNKNIVKRIDDNIDGIRDWVQTQEYRYIQTRKYDFDKTLLHTAFSFMTCDGHIDKDEIAMIKEVAADNAHFGKIDIEQELESMVMGINAMGLDFLKDYFKVLEHAKFNHEQEIQLVNIALEIIFADNKVDYNELKFFKIFRTMLRITDAEIKENWPDLTEEFFERDIFSHAYLSHLFEDYFDKIELPEFEI